MFFIIVKYWCERVFLCKWLSISIGGIIAKTLYKKIFIVLIIIIIVYSFYPFPLSSKFDRLKDMDIQLSIPGMEEREGGLIWPKFDTIELIQGSEEHSAFLELMNQYTIHNSIIRTIVWNITNSVSNICYSCSGYDLKNNYYHASFTSGWRYIYIYDSISNQQCAYRIGYIWSDDAEELEHSMQRFVEKVLVAE